MRKLIYLMAVLLLVAPFAARAELTADDLPATSTWYVHVDFDEMRKPGASRDVYDWLDGEVFEEIRKEAGIDFDKEINQFTAYAMEGAGPVIVLEGPISQASRDKIMALAAVSGDMQPHKARGKAYYYYRNREGGDEEDSESSNDIDIEFDNDEMYFTLDLKDRIVITASQEQMEDMLANNGRIKAQRNHKDALFVLSAERNLLQAGADAETFPEEGDGWNSNILRNTRQLALLVADIGGKIALDAQLLATEPEMAESLASIARGLISLASFDEDLEPGVAEVLRSTKVDVKDSTLQVSLAVDPDVLVALLKD